MDSTTTFEAWWAGMGVAATTGLRILAIAGAAWLLIVVLQRLIRGPAFRRV